jgi:cellulose synthase/poly-beta-1,6-N-acetylglucosamine synthase-like glycosyltransferase
MHIAVIFIFGFTACFWLGYGLATAYGAMKLPWLKTFHPAKDEDCAKISLIFAARDEEEKLPGALETLMKIDYPNLEIIAVDDRSEDGTAKILDDFAARHERLKVIHISNLPADWLGKPHALQNGYEAAGGAWLLFTDADVRFRADTLRRSITLANELRLEHLTLFGDVEMSGFWETILLTYFAMAFNLATQPHRVSNPNSRAYVGVGAFQMVKRKAYERAGTHRRLAMEVVDDLKLGKIVKQSGFRSGVAIAQDAVSVRWHAGARKLVRGVEKNFFAGAQYNLVLVGVQVLSLLWFNVLPVLGLVFGHGWVRGLAAVSVLVPLCFHIGVDVVMRVSPLYCMTYPLGAVMFAYMLLRSTVITLRQRGIIWRGTFYSLDRLKRGSV